MFDKTHIEANLETRSTSLIRCFTDIDQIVAAKIVGSSKVDWYRHEFFKKIFNHLVSAKVLSGGTIVRFPDKEIPSKDISAINLIVRASLEAFLLFHYIYVDSGNNEARDFRFGGWWREGLVTLLEYDVEGPEATKVKERVRKEAEEIVERLKLNPEFEHLTEGQKKSFLEKGKWKSIGWKGMLGRTDFNSSYRNTAVRLIFIDNS